MSPRPTARSPECQQSARSVILRCRRTLATASKDGLRTQATVILRGSQALAPQDDDFFFDVFFFLSADFFLVTSCVAPPFFAPFRGFGRLRNAARCAAAKAVLAQAANSSESSNSRAGNCQYELTVTVFAVVLC